jgi:molybdopterin/thiamine biosynthesis adenylyltransferase
VDSLIAFLKDHAVGDLVPWSFQVNAATLFGITLAETEEAILEQRLLPSRYQRNRETIDVSGQLDLFRSRVAVIGCGGLGGYIIEELTRLGVGQIVAIDPDIFEEHNLNRQLLSTPQTLGQAKVHAAAERVALVNPAVTLIPVRVALGRDNGHELLRGATVAVDALDSIPVRLELAEICNKLTIPLVHGAIGGWYGHVSTQYPGEQSVEMIYSTWTEGKGAEKWLGNPSFTPAVVASLQVAEVCKIILKEGEPLRRRKLAIDLLSMEFHDICLL